MGNSISYQAINNAQGVRVASISKESLIDTIDDIAVNLILKQNSIDMIRLTDKSYYDNLIVLTSSILKNQLTDLEIGILRERVVGNLNHNTMKEPHANKEEVNSNLYITTTKKLKQISKKNEKQKQKALLIISKFYIKILTIYCAITSVIDPQYSYNAENGTRKIFNLKDIQDVALNNTENAYSDKNIHLHNITNKANLLNHRLRSLKSQINKEGENGNIIVLNPSEVLCAASEGNSQANMFEKSFGHLDALYNDVYDYDEMKWNKKSAKMEKKFNNDLKRLYQIFTGKSALPNDIKQFSDIAPIKLEGIEYCANYQNHKDIIIDRKDNAYINYKRKIDKIEEVIVDYKKRLLHILKSLFVVVENNHDTTESTTQIIINPELNIEKIEKIQQLTQDCILNLYSKCEQYYIEALLILEEIYERFNPDLDRNLESEAINESETINETDLSFNDRRNYSPEDIKPNSNMLPATSLAKNTFSNPLSKIPSASIKSPFSSSQLQEKQNYTPLPTSPNYTYNVNIPPQDSQANVTINQFVEKGPAIGKQTQDTFNSGSQINYSFPNTLQAQPVTSPPLNSLQKLSFPQSHNLIPLTQHTLQQDHTNIDPSNVTTKQVDNKIVSEISIPVSTTATNNTATNNAGHSIAQTTATNNAGHNNAQTTATNNAGHNIAQTPSDDFIQSPQALNGTNFIDNQNTLQTSQPQETTPSTPNNNESTKNKSFGVLNSIQSLLGFSSNNSNKDTNEPNQTRNAAIKPKEINQDTSETSVQQSDSSKYASFHNNKGLSIKPKYFANAKDNLLSHTLENTNIPLNQTNTAGKTQTSTMEKEIDNKPPETERNSPLANSLNNTYRTPETESNSSLSNSLNNTYRIPETESNSSLSNSLNNTYRIPETERNSPLSNSLNNNFFSPNDTKSTRIHQDGGEYERINALRNEIMNILS